VDAVTRVRIAALLALLSKGRSCQLSSQRFLSEMINKIAANSKNKKRRLDSAAYNRMRRPYEARFGTQFWMNQKTFLCAETSV